MAALKVIMVRQGYYLPAYLSARGVRPANEASIGVYGIRKDDVEQFIHVLVLTAKQVRSACRYIAIIPPCPLNRREDRARVEYTAVNVNEREKVSHQLEDM